MPVSTTPMTTLAEPVVKTAIDIFKGFGQYLRGDVQTFLDGLSDAALESEAKRVAAAVGAEAERIAQHLERVELPRADQSNVLGRERYEHLLLAQEALATPIEDLERLAEQARDLAVDVAEVAVPRRFAVAIAPHDEERARRDVHLDVRPRGRCEHHDIRFLAAVPRRERHLAIDGDVRVAVPGSRGCESTEGALAVIVGFDRLGRHQRRPSRHPRR